MAHSVDMLPRRVVGLNRRSTEAGRIRRSRLPGKGPRVGAGLGRNWVILTVAQVALVLVAIACLIGMFASSRGGGVADSPALEVRAKYELMSHGHRAEVSRTRYVIASASFSTGWHALALLANVGALKRRFAS